MNPVRVAIINDGAVVQEIAISLLRGFGCNTYRMTTIASNINLEYKKIRKLIW